MLHRRRRAPVSRCTGFHGRVAWAGREWQHPTRRIVATTHAAGRCSLLTLRNAGFIALVVAGALARSVLAEDVPQGKSQCSVRSAEGSIRVVVCPPGLDMEALHVAGQAACGLTVICNAWIWDNAEKAPKNSPSKDSEIAQKDAGNAIAVWANDKKRLMLIKRVAK
jgi:hypothetical protein